MFQFQSGWFAKSTYGQMSDDLLTIIIPDVHIDKCKEFSDRADLDGGKLICGEGSVSGTMDVC